MSQDSCTEVTEQSWFSRIGGAFKGIIFGLILFLAAFVLLFWNEGRSVKTYKTLKEGSGAVVSVPADRVDPADQGKLVHVNGRAVTEATLTDPVFGVTANAIKLRREAEMYQWEETSHSTTEKKLGGGTKTVTTYSYSKVWSGHAINSASFHQSGYNNPGSMPYQDAEQLASRVTLGAFTLPTSLIRKIGGAQSLPVSSEIPLPEELAGRAQRQDGGLYLGGDPAAPQVGDMRIRFEIVPQQDISLIAQQNGNSFAPYQASTGEDIFDLRAGLLTAKEMFHKAEQENIYLTWILRAVGFILMFAGASMMLKIFSVLADIVPFFGNLVGAGAGIISFLIAGLLSLLTIAAAWITFRPLLGVSLLAAAAVLAFLIKGKMGRAKPQAAVPPPPPRS